MLPIMENTTDLDTGTTSFKFQIKALLVQFVAGSVVYFLTS